jgi:hypothetical protein
MAGDRVTLNEKDILEAHEHFSPADRYELLRDAIHQDELRDVPDFKIGTGPYAEQVRLLQLPTLQGEPIQPWEAFGGYYNGVGEIAIVKVRQGALLDTDSNEVEPYGYLSMSECSALIGRSDDRLLIAHIGFSEAMQVDSALAYFAQAGVEVSDIQAVISTNQPEKYTERLRSVTDYTDRGLSEERCHPFAFERDENNYNGLIEVTSGIEGISLSQFDAKLVSGLYTKFEEVPDSRRTKFIAA